MNPPRIPGRRLLHSPGPTPVPDEVLHAMLRQPTDLGDPAVAQLIDDCERGLQRLLQTTTADVFLYAANGHGGWEAVIANLVGPGTVVLIPGTGHFSDSWAEQVRAFGGEALRTPWREGLPIDPAEVEALLRADSGHRIAAVFTVHTDTASSVTSDVPAIARAIQAAGHPALHVVDVVASLGAAPFAMDALGIDVVMGASQKGLMGQPGLAFVAANARALAVAQRNPAPRFYWDWARRRGAMPYQKFCGTAPLAHLAGLRAAVGLIESEGLDAVWARHQRLAGAVQAAVTAWGHGFALFAREPAARSVSVSAIQTPAGVDPEAIRKVAREQFQVAVAGGLGPLSGRVFRIGHLGDQNEAQILGCLAGVEAAMRWLALPFDSGLPAAQQALIDAARLARATPD